MGWIDEIGDAPLQKNMGVLRMSTKDKTHNALEEHNIELPQSIVESFARFLVPVIRKYYEGEEGKKALEEWERQRLDGRD